MIQTKHQKYNELKGGKMFVSYPWQYPELDWNSCRQLVDRLVNAKNYRRWQASPSKH